MVTVDEVRFSLKAVASGVAYALDIGITDSGKIGTTQRHHFRPPRAAVFNRRQQYGGLRVPSEICALKWQHIDWEGGSILVPCLKTEHHDGKDVRLVCQSARITGQ